ncbi:MAG: DUF885 domain-containing protein [Pseudomonadota bacterium]
MSRQIYRSLLALAATLFFTSAFAGEADDKLMRLIDDHWQYALQENPILATSAGINSSNNRLPGVSQQDEARRLERERGFLNRLGDINKDELSKNNQVNYDLFAWVVSLSVTDYELGSSRIPFNSFSGFFTSALSASDGVAMESVADYEAYIARLNDFPRYFSENVENMRAGIRAGFVMPKIVIEGIQPTVAAQISKDPTESRLYKPFLAMNKKLPTKDAKRLQKLAKKAISESVNSALKDFSDFLRGDYMKAATDTYGISSVPGGDEYYRHQIATYVTLNNITPQEIHNIGLEEVARIRAEMDAIIAELEFEGSFEDFTNFLRTDPQFYAKSADELLQAAAYTAKRIDLVMPGFFGHLPRLPYGVVPVPDAIAPNYTTASYNPAPLGGTRGGAYWVNTYALDQRPLYELTALTLHEAVPGHHHQIAIAQELGDVPDFRRQLYLSAFGEGWALYTEKLGVEMGVYRTPYEQFGRLSYEMWRACRLVIDTGVHAMGWPRQRALDYLSDNTSLSKANVRAEVDRYISWPGQALAYKLGELKIWELRREAEARLGNDFDLAEFHDKVLGNGALPLTMLENQIRRYIDEKLEAREAAQDSE